MRLPKISSQKIGHGAQEGKDRLRGRKILFGPLSHWSWGVGFSLFPRFPVIDRPKNKMVEKIAAHR
jgi:hypothetical protein